SKQTNSLFYLRLVRSRVLVLGGARGARQVIICHLPPATHDLQPAAHLLPATCHLPLAPLPPLPLAPLLSCS
ncbi:MAG: hypothetical protein ACPGWR_12660, partial [Ardenticatenaceae bacterium]